MDPNTFPTKGNLILAKNSLALSLQGFDLMDKKRNILIREMMNLIDEAKGIQSQIDVTFREAYGALQRANMEIGINTVQTISYTVPIEDSIRIKTRSIMGTEIPLVESESSGDAPTYAFYSTKESLDAAKQAFEKVKELTIRLSMVENAAYRLAANIKKTQKRANALKNITIPHYEQLTKDISNALEEKEREEFTRLKVIKRMKGAGAEPWLLFLNSRKLFENSLHFFLLFDYKKVNSFSTLFLSKHRFITYSQNICFLFRYVNHGCPHEKMWIKWITLCIT